MTSRLDGVFVKDPNEVSFWNEIEAGGISSVFLDDLFARLCTDPSGLVQGLADRILLDNETPDGLDRRLVELALWHAQEDTVADAQDAKPIWATVRVTNPETVRHYIQTLRFD